MVKQKERVNGGEYLKKSLCKFKNNTSDKRAVQQIKYNQQDDDDEDDGNNKQVSIKPKLNKVDRYIDSSLE